MLLRPAYTYLFLDFETTGLDVAKDDAIQVGLVQMNHTGEITNTFSSFLRPHTSVQELKTIITYLTQTTIEDLQNAPSRDDIAPQLAPFFTDNVVIIGHNVGFDLAFLAKYTGRKPLYTIDTFPLSKACFHFLPSYALEVIAKERGEGDHTAHDALSDCLVTQKVFMACVHHLQKIRKTYMIFDYVIQKTTCPLTTLLQRTNKPYDFTGKTLFLPPLTRPVQQTKKLIQPDSEVVHKNDLQDATTYFVGNMTLAALLGSIQRTEASWLLSFSHKSKLQLAEASLRMQGAQPTLLTDDIQFLPERIDLLLHKELFDEGELLFVAKYLSHHLQTHTRIDINTSDDYKIVHALTEHKPPHMGQITLTTHEQLFSYPHTIDPRTQILFFDVDRWWQTRAIRQDAPLDPHYILQEIEQEIYKATLLHDATSSQSWEILSTELSLFFGVLGGEIDHLFVGYPEQTMEIDAVADHTRLPKSKLLLEKLLLESTIAPADSDASVRRKKLQERLTGIFSQPTTIIKNMYQNTKRWYTFKSQKIFYTFQEVMAHLPHVPSIYLSTLQAQQPHLGIGSNQQSTHIHTHIHTPAEFLATLADRHENIFVLSTSKSHAHDLFQQLVRAKKDQQWLILAENITGGVGKIVYLATQSKKPVIMIGGFGCYLASCVKKFAISALFAYYCEGKQAELLLADISFYRQ